MKDTKMMMKIFPTKNDTFNDDDETTGAKRSARGR